MIISDLQHIESATKTKVQGGCRRPGCWAGGGGNIHPVAPTSPYPPYKEAGSQDFETDTQTSTTVDPLVI